MKSSMGRVVFREFLKCEYSEENILFWLACEDLKKDNNPEVVEEKARLIYEDYISILSPKEVLFTSYILWRYTPLYCVCICASSCGFEFIKSTTSPNGLFRPLFTGLHAYTICEETNSIRYSPLCCAILTYFIRRFHLTALRYPTNWAHTCFGIWKLFTAIDRKNAQRLMYNAVAFFFRF